MMRGKGEKAPQKPWEGAEGLEWEVPRRRRSTPSRRRPSWMPPPPACRLTRTQATTAAHDDTPEQREAPAQRAAGLILASVVAVF
jgi:hypothetical protein